MIEISIKKIEDLSSVFLQRLNQSHRGSFRIELIGIDTGWIIRTCVDTTESETIVSLKETISILVSFEDLDILQTLVKVDDNFLMGDNPPPLSREELTIIYCLIGEFNPSVGQKSPHIKQYKFHHRDGFHAVFSNNMVMPS